MLVKDVQQRAKVLTHESLLHLPILNYLFKMESHASIRTHGVNFKISLKEMLIAKKCPL